MNLTITLMAENFMRRMVRFGNAGATAGFRLVVSPGGCSGLSSEFTVERAPHFGDYVIELEFLRVFMPKASRDLLEGCIIDFADAVMEAGLKFFNPNAHGTCGGSCSSTVIGS
ncbi:heme biosynthesis protein HemY [Sulfuricella sp. T08]|uniref:HesB/IscA family protein n=1 Tax=Sulfuricella sp. T08 TaxID=1632857 RepID=UPI0006179C91|nr:iron-sulfur cluster assembly accessory protein [Sulfuricella sp. T08]GAO35425.1 heme biosynthesis protein HemY [Sulfuricella sp. T08]